jgi:hypothetical protein
MNSWMKNGMVYLTVDNRQETQFLSNIVQKNLLENNDPGTEGLIVADDLLFTL